MVQLRKTRECVDKMEHVCFWGKLVIMIEITSWWHLFKNYETMEKLEMCNWGKLCMPRVLKIFHASFVMCDVKDTSYLWNWGKPVVSKHHRNWAQLRKIKSLSVYNLWNLWHNQKIWCALLRKKVYQLTAEREAPTMWPYARGHQKDTLPNSRQNSYCGRRPSSVHHRN